MIYVPNGDSNSTSVIDGKTNKVVAHVTVGNDPHVIAINPKNNMVYVTNFGGGEGITNTVSVIDGNTNKVVANVTVGSSPHSVAVNPVTDRVYVTRQDEDIVSVIDGSNDRVLANVTVGFQPHGIAVNPVTDLIYVTNTASNSFCNRWQTNRMIDTIMITYSC
jgi:YVTN family beta-propeller protein